VEAENMDTLRQEKAYTIDDIYSLPDGERAELIDGKIYYMAPPNTKHQRLVHFFDREIGNYIQNNNGECEVLPAPFAVFLNEDEINYVEPDISVICDRDKITDKGCNGAPDWIIEIVSPGNKPMDYFTKLFKYRSAGVREYWIVDPTREVVTVYRFEKETMEQYSFGEDIPVGLYEDFSIKVE
jgi:Uma2 family endonuclease